MRVICIVGLPGSGKTYLAEHLAISGDIIIDDIKSMDQLPENSDNILIITDPYFCIDDVREKAKNILTEKYESVSWIFFENNPEKCLVNVQYRSDGRSVENFINFLTKIYNPSGDDIRIIWQPK